MRYSFFALIIFALASANLIAQSSGNHSDVVGKWDLTFQTEGGNSPAWLEIKRSGGRALTGYYVGSEGSARPISKIKYSEDDQLFEFTIPPQWEQLDDDLHFKFRLDDEALIGTADFDNEMINWNGKKAPSLVREDPPVWGNPISLLDENMSKWIIPENNKFQVEDGILVNSEAGGNLVTKETFDDFKIHLEFRYPEGSNSGVYLKGRYEVQIADQYGQQPNDQLIGGVYGFIYPSENAARQAGEWQTMDVTLVGRIVTVVLNGTEVVSNRPVRGITGGALDSNEEEPGPIMLQGDHGPVEFRKIVITPSIN